MVLELLTGHYSATVGSSSATSGAITLPENKVLITCTVATYISINAASGTDATSSDKMLLPNVNYVLTVPTGRYFSHLRVGSSNGNISIIPVKLGGTV
jgi:hypothetical protein|tara:strand:- start:92 stop:385 length:294 start_codon:yes stop_codon:yes gene_type:complete